MTTSLLNKKLFSELSAIADDEAKVRQAIAALHLIAAGKSPQLLYSGISRNEGEKMTDDQWEKYFANKPAVALPKDTDTRRFVKAYKGRTIKQMRQWL